MVRAALKNPYAVVAISLIVVLLGGGVLPAHGGGHLPRDQSPGGGGRHLL
jgi:hypothetical protein